MGLFRLQLVPPNFVVPETADGGTFHLHPLRLQDSLEDYRAIMADFAGHLRNFYAKPDLSREETYDIHTNMRELGWHETEFLHRSSFTYVIRGKEPGKPSYRGCVYLFPTAKRGYDVEVYLWLTQVVPDDGLQAEVLEWTQRWIDADWPFARPLFPYHVVGWAEYEALPDGRSYTGQHWW